MSRWSALALASVLLLGTWSALFRDARRDSFPFSTYPMFARTIDKRWLVVAEGVSDRVTMRLPPELVANDEPMQAMRTLRLAARQGEPALRALCARVAERVATASALRSVRRVRIVRGLFDPLTYFEAAPEPERRQVLRECRVRGRR